MSNPSIMLNVQDGKHRLVFNEQKVIGTDYDDFRVIIPVICDNCNFRIFHNDKLIQTEVNQRQMGSEIYYANNMDDIYYPKCNNLIHVKVELSQYAHNFIFHDYEIEKCKLSEAFNSEKLD